ncbi:MAG: SusC/RagA family TonB-linked outer membrane protein [Ferruginibacter sp.]
MKYSSILTFLIFDICMQLAGKAMSQRITISGDNIPVEKVFEIIKNQSNYSFFYDYNLLKNTKSVSMHLANASVEEVLTKTLANQPEPLTFTIESSVIVIRAKDNQEVKKNISPLNQLSESIILNGLVTNELNEPLAGAMVYLKGMNKKTITDEKGAFQLEITSAEASKGSIVVTYSGYNSYEAKINYKKFLAITLSPFEKQLQDVVINSYSKPIRKEDVVGSITSISNKQLQTDRPIESFDKMLEGMAPGVQVVESTELGTPVKINIRGQNSLSALNSTNVTQLTTSSQPLFIIDGVPVTEQRRGDEPIAFLNNEQLLNPLAEINPDDIESISILKDAAASSIYGANASNGVVIITTKKGRNGKTHLNIGYTNGWGRSINMIKWLNGSQYHDLLKEMYINDGRSEFDAEILAGSPTINTPWFQLVNRYSSYDNVDLDLAGGNDKTTFRLSGTFLNQEAIQKGNDYKKMYLRLRVDHKISDKFRMGVSLAPTITDKNALNLYSNVPIIPNAPSYNADGTFFKFSTLGVPNPLAVLAQNTNYHSGGSFNGNINFEYKILKDLTASTIFGVDALQNKLNIFDSPKNATGASKNGFAQIYDRTNFSWISTSQLNWTTRFHKFNKLDLTTGFEAQDQSTKLLRGSGTGFTYYRLNELSNASSQTSSSSYQESTSIAVYGQAAYSYKEKYFSTLSGRYDAASIFGNDVNATVNAAIGLGWNIYKEKFLKNSRWIDMLRLRLSYGSTGNSRIGSYQARGLYGFNNAGYNDGTSSYPTSAPNDELSWEKDYKRNVGIDFNFLKHFNVTFDFYTNILDDAISPIPISPENGFTTVLANIGKMRNQGFDGSISTKINFSKFNWTSTLNFGYNKNIILQIKNSSALYGFSTEGTVLKEGVSTSAIWGFKFAGVDPATGREMYYDKTGKIVSVFDLDRNPSTGGTYLGDRLPYLQGGFINTFSFKGLNITVNILYSLGGKILIDYNNENNGRNLNNRNQSVNLLSRWQKPGDITNIPLLSASSNPLVYTSSKYVYDATYIKLGNLSVSYTIPQSVIRHLSNIGISVFANATNLCYWYKEKSPAGLNGIKEYRFSFPEAQTFTWGLKVNL